MSEVTWQDPNIIKPGSSRWVLLAVKLDHYSKKTVTHIGCWTPKFTEETDSEDWYEVNEENDTAYTPEGWYQQCSQDEEYRSMYINDLVVAWAVLPEFGGFNEL